MIAIFLRSISEDSHTQRRVVPRIISLLSSTDLKEKLLRACESVFFEKVRQGQGPRIICVRFA
jgi:hypothetical protein